MDGTAPAGGALGELAFERAPYPVAVIDRWLRLQRVNPAFDALFGAPRGRPCHEVIKGRDIPCERCPLRVALRSGDAVVSEERGRAADRRELQLRVHVHPLAGGRGQVPRALQVLEDRTEIAELHRALRQTERLATVGLTAAGMAHTIKNILSGLEGGTYMLRTGIERGHSDRITAGWRMVERYIEQIGELVRNMLRYSTAQEPQFEPVDLRDLLRDAARLYQAKADLAEIRLSTRVARDMPPLLLDRESIHGCVVNLLSNAVDACTWDPDTDKEHHITISARREDDGGVRVQVRDDGPGIALADQPHVLETYFTTKGIRGTGLGLLLTRKAIEEHGGRVSFASKPGQGATFRLHLPAERVLDDDAGEPG